MKQLQIELQKILERPDHLGYRVRIDRTCPYTDYCKEVCEPYANANYPEGCVGIRVDDDFWPVLIIPLKFRELTVQEIVAVAFPDAKDPKFMADSGTEEQWQERYKAMTVTYERIVKGLIKQGYTEEKAKEEADLYNPDRDLGKSLREEQELEAKMGTSND